MGKCKKNFLYINSNFGLVHKIKTLFIFLIFWFFLIFFEVEDNFVFEQFFECFTWCAKNISLRVIKVWNIVFDEEVVGSYVFCVFFWFFFVFLFVNFSFKTFNDIIVMVFFLLLLNGTKLSKLRGGNNFEKEK